MVEGADFIVAKKLILQIADLKNKLQELKIIKSDYKIPKDYAKWFCSKKYKLKLYDLKEFGYDAITKFGEKVQIKSKIGLDSEFGIVFDDINLSKLDYLFVVFLDKKTWMINSIYKVSIKVVNDFLSIGTVRSFNWCGESRSLSLQLYPDEDNMIML